MVADKASASRAAFANRDKTRMAALRSVSRMSSCVVARWHAISSRVRAIVCRPGISMRRPR